MSEGSKVDNPCQGDKAEYECGQCTYWSAIHGCVDGYTDEKYKKCLRCPKRLRIYRQWIEMQG